MTDHSKDLKYEQLPDGYLSIEMPGDGSLAALGLTRIGGHPEAFVRGATDAENTPAVFTRVSPPDGGARACWT